MSLRIGILGPIPRDTITTHRGEEIKKYGCVTHPAVGLSRLLGADDRVVPVAHIHEVDEDAVVELLEPYGNIELQHISSIHDQGAVVQLVFVNQNDREETQTGAMRPISPTDVLGAECSVYVCVPITDYEVPLDTLVSIKEDAEALVIFDAHGPTTQVDLSGHRFRVHWLDMLDWLPYIDVLKMNLEESLYCYYPPGEVGDYDAGQRDHLAALAELVLGAGVQHLYVTLDSDGCQWFTKVDGVIQSVFVPAYPVDHVVDTTGCGDSFAGGLAFGFGRFGDPLLAAQYANILGAMRTQGKTFEVFHDFEKTERMRQEYYGAKGS